MLLWPFGQDFVKEAPQQLTIALPCIHPLEYLAETTTRMVAFLCNAHVANKIIGTCDYQDTGSVTTG